LIAAGLSTFDRPTIHVVVRRGATIRRRPGVVVHTSSLDLRAVPGSGAPRVSTAHAAVQAAFWERQEKTARGLVIASIQQRLTTAAAVRAALVRAQRHPRTPVLRRLLEEIETGADSALELEFLRLAERARLPAPSRQVSQLVDGRRRRVDFDFGRFIVEVDGPLHASNDPDAEAMRRNDVSRGGRPVLQFTSTLIRFEPDRVVATLRGAWRDLAA
jgi:very-short-patch-repair endonuclease